MISGYSDYCGSDETTFITECLVYIVSLTTSSGLVKTFQYVIFHLILRSLFDHIPIYIIILPPITNHPVYSWLADNPLLVSLSCLNEYGNEDEKWEWFRDRILT